MIKNGIAIFKFENPPCLLPAGLSPSTFTSGANSPSAPAASTLGGASLVGSGSGGTGATGMVSVKSAKVDASADGLAPLVDQVCSRYASIQVVF